MELFKDRFIKLRKEHGFTLVDLADKLGVSKSVISYWETGRNEPTICMLKKIAAFFDVSADYLIGLEDEFGYKYK